MKEAIDEKKTAAASYILSFYQNVEALTGIFSQYINVMLELQEKYGEGYVNKCGEEEKTAITQVVQNARFIVSKTYIQYRSIAPSLKIKEENKINKMAAKIRSSYIILRDDLEAYTVEMNRVLVSEVIQQLLVSSQSILGSLYDDKKE